MKKFAFAFILVISIRGFGQKVDYYVTPSGDTISTGDTLYAGPGTMPDGTYKYLTGFITPGVGMTGHFLVVKSIIKRGSKKSGYKYYAKVHPGMGIVNYELYIDYGLKSGEVSLKP